MDIRLGSTLPSLFVLVMVEGPTDARGILLPNPVLVLGAID